MTQNLSSAAVVIGALRVKTLSEQHIVVVVFVFNVPPTAKVIWRRGYGLKVSSDRLVKPGIEPAASGLQGKQFIHYTTAAPMKQHIAKS